MAVEDVIDEKLASKYEYEAEEAYMKKQMYAKKAVLEEQPFLVGEPKVWSQITEDQNKKQWIWENYIAKGHSTLLSALWKAGKSTLLRHLFITIHNQSEFAGQPTYKSRILVVSEENEGEWLEQKEELDSEEIDHVFIWSRPIRVKPNLKQWVQFIEELTAYVLENKIDLVVIDTLSTFWPIDNENDSAQVLKALVPLYALTENNIAVLLVHHFRKGGGDQAQASRGSGALPGFVDNIIEFTRKDDGFPNQRILKTYGRFSDVIPQVVIELGSDGVYKTLGQPWEVSKSARLDKIIEIVVSSKEPLSVKEIFNSCIQAGVTITLRSVQNYIKDLVFKNILSSVESRLVGKKLTDFYAQNLTDENPLRSTIDTFRQLNFADFEAKSKSTDENGTLKHQTISSTDESPLRSLSSVNPKFVPPADETKGTSPKENTSWEEPPEIQ